MRSTGSPVKLVLAGLVCFAMLVLGIMSLSSGTVSCGGETMRPGDTCESRGVTRSPDAQQSENNGLAWIMIVVGGLGTLGFGAVALAGRRVR
ncbi:hypothetical protein OG943_14295 [Amycolatopsis sp. NBC_00345]|uniref:hypothetical protein n=1 Tax=Amycolatopsis sp. NBC_00345 TaxID=2975955 RepID=UPI002E2627F4